MFVLSFVERSIHESESQKRQDVLWPCIKLISSTDDFKQAAMFNEVL
jgi:hypothetical protein